jgi:hypothetical protein
MEGTMQWSRMNKIFFLTLMNLHCLSWAEVRVVPVEPTPEPNNVSLILVYPKCGELKESGKVDFQFRLDGLSIGTDTEYRTRARELRYDPNSQSIRILVDNSLCIEMNEALIDALDNNAVYLTQRITGKLNCPLSDGEHILQAFPVRSYDESIKGAESYVASVFYINNKDKKLNVDLNKPYITYNQPYGTFTYHKDRPILLDFLVKNCELSSDGYKIRFSIDGKVERLITLWIPYYIYSLPQGTHTIRLELLDPFDNPVQNGFADVSRTIEVK